jgi:glucose-1-phosphate cytidylyltransferase
MKVVILAGGQGRRLAEQTRTIPKPMLDVGGRPLVWHIMKHFAVYGYRHFVLALGYKADVFKDFFCRYPYLDSNLTVSLSSGTIEIQRQQKTDWIVELVDTGLDAGTGGRLLALKDRLEGERFFVTYGDGLADVNLADLVEFHEASGNLVTLTAVSPRSQFGEVTFEPDGSTARFVEKPHHQDRWINGGFMVLEPEVLDRIPSYKASLEADVLEPLSEEGRLGAFKHSGFWACMDTSRDLEQLRELWDSGSPPWKTWDD